MAHMTLEGFTQKLQSGGYSQRGFASRAVNKSKDLSEADKKKALAAVDAHFGGQTPAPKAVKKAAARKPAKKAAPKKAAASPKKAPAKVRVASTPVVAKTASAPAGADSIETRLETYGKAIEHYANAAGTLKSLQTDKVSVEEGLKSAATGLTALVKSMHNSIVTPLVGAHAPAPGSHLNGSNGVHQAQA